MGPTGPTLIYYFKSRRDEKLTRVLISRTRIREDRGMEGE